MTVDKFAIDFDSATTSVYKAGSGMVLTEPTVAAVEDDGKFTVKAIGNEASKLIGKTSKGTKIIFPVFEGEIVNEKVAAGVLYGFLKKVGIKSRLTGATAIFSVPCGVTVEMLEKYRSVAKNSGIGKVYFAESPILSALGQRIPFNDSVPCFVIDMGGGTTNIAALTLNGIIAGISVNFGSNKVSTDVIDYIADVYGVQIGLQTAEKLKKEIGSLEEGDNLSLFVNGRDLSDGSPKSFTIKASDIYYPVKKYYEKIAEIACAVLKKLPPEVSAEINKSGVYVSGSASSIYGLEKFYDKLFDVKVNVADNAQYSVALGGGIALGNSEILKKICVKVN